MALPAKRSDPGKPFLPPRGRRGVTLVELIMVMVIMGIVAVPLTMLLIAHVEGVFDSSSRITALQLGRLKMEILNNTDYDSLLTGTETDYAGYPFDVTTTVTYIGGNGASAESLKKVQVEVMKSGNSEIIENLITYRVKNVQFGV